MPESRPLYARVQDAIKSRPTDADLDELERELVEHDRSIDGVRQHLEITEEQRQRMDATSIMNGLHLEAVRAVRRGDTAEAQERWNRMMEVAIAVNGGPKAYVELLQRSAEVVASARQSIEEARRQVDDDTP